MSTLDEFEPFPKIGRLSRECMITEKIDGSNAQICITPEGKILAGSRSRWLTPEKDNFGFAKWVLENETELRRGLAVGRHFGEWWGLGIQRRYGLLEKRFSLFNAHRWTENPPPTCCSVVPVLYRGPFDSREIEKAMATLSLGGSLAAPGFMNPEGIIIFHQGVYFKKTFEHDEKGKGNGASEKSTGVQESSDVASAHDGGQVDNAAGDSQASGSVGASS